MQRLVDGRRLPAARCMAPKMLARENEMKLSEYLDGMRAANTADDLEAAIQAPFKHSFRGRVWSQISKVRIEAGNRIVGAHPNSFYIPTLGSRNLLACCGETCRVGYGAGVWAQGLLRKQGFGIRAAARLWDSDWHEYPHRCIKLVGQILAGEFPDPQMGVMIRRDGVFPIKYSVEENERDVRPRPTRPCECGGTLFDWGGGHDYGFEYINWRCNKCPDVLAEYMTREQLYALRSARSPHGTGKPSGPAT